MSDTTADVVVIGAGVIGSAVALELQRSGRSVVCVDKGPRARRRFHERVVGDHPLQLLDARLRAHRMGVGGAVAGLGRVPRHGGSRRDGEVRAGGQPHLLHAGLRRDRDHGAVGRRRDSLRALRCPGAAPAVPGLDVGCYFPPKRVDDPAFGDEATRELTAFYNAGSGFIDDPMLAAHNLANAALANGAEFRFRVAVTAIDRRAGRVTGVTLSTGRADLRPGRRQRRRAALRPAQRAGRGHRRHAHRPPSAAPRGVRRAGTRRVRARRGWTGRRRPRHRPVLPAAHGRHLLVGGTEPECDELDWVERSRPVRRSADSRAAGRRRCCGSPAGCPSSASRPDPSGLAALYDASDDWVPIYDRSSLDGYYMACGTSGNQFKNAPLAGQFIRTLVDAAAAGVDHDADPVSFTGPLTGPGDQPRRLLPSPKPRRRPPGR